jgi:hypothetical protein
VKVASKAKVVFESQAVKKADDQKLKELLDADEGWNVDSIDDVGSAIQFSQGAEVPGAEAKPEAGAHHVGVAVRGVLAVLQLVSMGSVPCNSGAC